jgi:hypothetical protein
MNILQALGLQSPGIVADDYSGGGSDYGAAPQQPVNAFQGLNQPPPASLPMPDAMPAATPVTQPARSRSSILDHIGRVADVLATVGGAAPLYQPTLDARQDRELTLGDHARTVDLDKLKLATAQHALGNAHNARLAQAARGVQAILAANPHADAAAIWPLMARQAGLPEDRAAEIGRQIAADPNALAGIATLDQDAGDAVTAAKAANEKFSGQMPVLVRNKATGEVQALQPSLGSGEARNLVPDGYEYVDATKPVNLGGVTAIVGTHSPQRILPNSEKPGSAADRAERGREADNRNRTAIQVAGMPARAKAGEKAGGDASNVSALLDNIEGGFRDLHGMNALPGDDGGVASNVLAAAGRTRMGQAIGEQAGSAAAQKRLEIAKNVSALQQAMLKSLPASATRTKFEQEMLARGLPDATKMSLGTANTVIRQLRESFARAQAELAAKGGGTRTPVRPVLRSPAAARPAASPGKPTVSNW